MNQMTKVTLKTCTNNPLIFLCSTFPDPLSGWFVWLLFVSFQSLMLSIVCCLAFVEQCTCNTDSSQSVDTSACSDRGIEASPQCENAALIRKALSSETVNHCKETTELYCNANATGITVGMMGLPHETPGAAHAHPVAQRSHTMTLRSHAQRTSAVSHAGPSQRSSQADDSESVGSEASGMEPFASTLGNDAFHLRVIVVNCGQSGLLGKWPVIVRYADDVHANVVAASETHMTCGDALPFIDGWTCITEFVPGKRTRHGGVACLVRDQVVRQCQQKPQVVWRSWLSDVVWVQFNHSNFIRPMLLCITYFPPRYHKYECKKGCTMVQSCTKSHSTEGLLELSERAQGYVATNDILVVGDFNARLGEDWPWAREIAAVLLDGEPSFTLCNPVNSAGILCPTHSTFAMPGSKPHVLDLVLACSSNSIALPTCAIDRQQLISDHCPLVVTVMGGNPSGMVPPLARQAKLPASNVPLWARTRVVVPRVAVAAEFETGMCKCVASRIDHLPALPPMQAVGGAASAQSDALLALGAAAVSAMMVTAAEMSCQPNSSQSRRVQKAFQVELPPQMLQRERQAHFKIEKLRRVCMKLRARNAPFPQALVAEWNVLVQQRKTERVALSALSKKVSRLAQRANFYEMHRGIFSVQSQLEFVHSKNRGAARKSVRHGYPVISQPRWAEIELLVRERYGKPLYTDPTQCERAAECAAARIAHRTAMLTAIQNGSAQNVSVSLEELVTAISKLQGAASAIGCPVALVKTLASEPKFLAYLRLALDSVFTTFVIPDSIRLYKAVPIAKTGSIADEGNTKLRVLSVGTVFARLFESIVNERLTSFLLSSGALSDQQFGFIPHRSAEQALLVTRMATHATLRDKRPVYIVFVDLETAYPRVNRDVCMTYLAECNTPPQLWLLLDQWFQHQMLFIQLGSLVSATLQVQHGLLEGPGVSPILFDLYNEAPVKAQLAICQNTAFPPGTRPGLWHNGQLLHGCVWFADDGSMTSSSYQGAQAICNGSSTALIENLMKVNVGPLKTAACLLLPYDKTARARVRAFHGALSKTQRDVTGPGAPLYSRNLLTMGGATLSFVEHYKLLGTPVHQHGAKAAEHLAAHQLEKMGLGVYATASRSGVRTEPLWQGVNVYKLYYFPKLTYAWAVTFNSVPAPLRTVESRILKLITGTAHLPDVVMRCILGLPSLESRLSLRKLALLESILNQPSNHMLRLALAADVQGVVTGHDPSVTSRAWWSGILLTLNRLSEAQKLVVHDPQADLEVDIPWEDALQACANVPGEWHPEQKAVFEAFKRQYRSAQLAVELRVQEAALKRCEASTQEVRELLAGPNSAPFVIEPRSAACNWRIRARGGVLGAFGYKYRASQVKQCLMCGQAGAWSIPHLVRDCATVESERLDAWTDALQFGIQCGVMRIRDSSIEHHRQQWYLLTMGAAVPETFCHVGTSAVTHFDRPEGATATRQHNGKKRGIYLKLLRVTGEFLVALMTACVQLAETVMGSDDAEVSSGTESVADAASTTSDAGDAVVGNGSVEEAKDGELNSNEHLQADIDSDDLFGDVEWDSNWSDSDTEL